MDRLQQVGTSYRALRRAGAAANFSGITTLILGLASLSCTIFDPSALGILASIALLAFGAIELLGRQQLLAGGENSLRILMWNQLAFFAAVAIYCLIQMATFSTQSLVSPETSNLLAEMSGGTGGLDPSIVKMGKLVCFALYSLIIVISFISQGGLALYYAKRQRHLDAFRAATEWERKLVMGVSA